MEKVEISNEEKAIYDLRMAIIDNKVSPSKVLISVLKIPDTAKQKLAEAGYVTIEPDLNKIDVLNKAGFDEKEIICINRDLVNLGIGPVTERQEVLRRREADRIGGKKSREILTEAFSILKDYPLFRDDMEKAYEKCKKLGKKHKIKSYKQIFYSALYAAYHDLDIDEVHPRCRGGHDLERITSITKGFE